MPKKVETKIPDYDSETKDYDDFEQSELVEYFECHICSLVET